MQRALARSAPSIRHLFGRRGMALATSSFSEQLGPAIEVERMNLFTAINNAMRTALKSDPTAVRLMLVFG